MHGGDEGEQLLFATRWRFFVMRRRDFGPCRFWAVLGGCGAPTGLGRVGDTPVTVQPPLPAALLCEDVEAQR